MIEQLLREHLSYNPQTGRLSWIKAPCNRVKVGNEAGYVYQGSGHSSYRQVKIKGIAVPAHRAAWFLHYGCWPANHIDHIDGDGLNNRIDNLRDVTHAGNQYNRQRLNCNNTSGHTGVSWHKRDKKWRAHIKVNGTRKYLGNFAEKGDAIKARQDAESRYWQGVGNE